MHSDKKRYFQHICRLAMLLVIVACGLTGCGGGGTGTDSSGNGDQSAPTATAGTLSAVMGAAQSGSLSGNGTGTLTYAITASPQDGSTSLTNAATGAFTYTSYPNFTGSDRLQFTVTNSVGASQPATETINVASGALGAEQAVANVGVSTDWVCYWCTMQPFVNVVRQSAAFGDPATGYPLVEEGKLDTNGWPESDFRWMVLCCLAPDASSADPGPESPLIGAYQLSFNGIAKIGDDGGKVEDQQYNSTTNTTTATLDQTPLSSDGSGFDMLLSFASTQRTATSTTGTGVTNIQIIRPQLAPNGMKWWDSPTQEFTDPFLASFKGFSTVRYINWTKVIGSPEINWADRTPGNWPVAGHTVEAAPAATSYLVPAASTCTQYCDWYGTGASWEGAIDAANATHTDMWINIPIMATDDYVKSLATLIQSKLDPGLHVYVEWSDEIWNYGNPYWTETNYAVNHVKALIASDPTEATNYANNCVGWADSECYVAERVMQFSNDFASVYGAAAINTTIRPVLCTQVVQPVFMIEALRFIDKTYGAPASYFYGTCGAPYWGPPSGSTTLPTGSTQSAAVAAMAQGIPATTGNLQTDTAVDLYYGLHNLTYEGGPGFNGITVSGDTAAQTTALDDAIIIDPAMQAQVEQGLSAAFVSGVDMYMYYEVAGPNNFGATIDPLDVDAPKLAGIQALAGQMLTRNAGSVLPGSISAVQNQYALLASAPVPTYQMRNCYIPTSGSAPSNCSFISSVAVGDGYGYLVDVPAAGNFSVSLGMVNASTASSLELAVDGKSVGTFTIPEAPSGTTPTTNTLSVTMSAGLHVIEMLNASTTSNCAVNAINFTSQ